MKSIAIIGCKGHVGSAISELMKNTYKVYGYDLNCGTKQECNKCDVAFVCVPTPKKKDGSCDTSIVEESVKWLQTDLIIIKSTVALGTTLDLKDLYLNKRIVFSPEFFGESKYYIPDEMHDKWKWPYHIFGGDKEDTSEAVDLFTEVLGPTKKYFQTDPTTAEFVKYAENVYFAMKVTFCQQLFDFCEAIGIDYNEMREMWVKDPRINPMHTSVFRHKRGYGGKCFPKDVSAFYHTAKEFNIDLGIVKEIINYNKKIRNDSKD